VSEYIHNVSHDDAEPQELQAIAQRSWTSLKRSAKAGARRTVSPQPALLR
jgi:hypothetical protein